MQAETKKEAKVPSVPNIKTGMANLYVTRDQVQRFLKLAEKKGMTAIWLMENILTRLES